MDDRIDMEMAKLASSPPPRPRSAAKAHAVALAVKAFEEEKKTSAGTQGSRIGRRFTDAIMHLWSLQMNRKAFYRSAAAALVLFPAAGFAVHHYLDRSVVGSTVAMKSAPEAAAPRTIHGSPMPLPMVRGQASAETRDFADALAQLDQQTVGPAAGGALPTIANAAKFQDASSEKLAAMQLAIIETMRLSTGQSSGEMRLATGQLSGDLRASSLPYQMPSVARFVAKEVLGLKSATLEPVSTFSVDVDTSSYAHARRSLQNGNLPDPDSVRVEEMVNYFPYDWKAPTDSDQPFKVNVSLVPTPWNPATKLLHVGIKGYDVKAAKRKAANIVFLVDVSGSMASQDKLLLLVSSLKMFLDTLAPTDTVSIVTYAGNSGVALEPTYVSEKTTILDALDGLAAYGGTAGAEGIKTAYDLAERSFVKDGVNRIFLATDGDFNIGAMDDDELKRLVEAKRKSGVFLSVLGFGGDNYNDGLMQTLAQNGNGVAAYIDTLSEAQKTLVQESAASVFTIAKDVKIQVEFNPAEVDSYRLVGYETRELKREDFNNDKVDAGEIGSGHTVTAIYEVTPKGSAAAVNDDLRYGKPDVKSVSGHEGELAYVKIRYKQPDGDTSRMIGQPVMADAALPSIKDAGNDVGFSVAVAAFGQKLRGESQMEGMAWDEIGKLAASTRGPDEFGYRSEFIRLVQLAKGLSDEAEPRNAGTGQAVPN